MVTQANEAVYVRLRSTVVYEWLRKAGVTDLPDWSSEGELKLSANIFQSAALFGKYFSELDPGQPNTDRYLYTLLRCTVGDLAGHHPGDNGLHVYTAEFFSGTLRLALAQAISLTDLLRPCGASVPTQHVAPASPATEKAGTKAGMKRGCLAEHPMKSIG